MARTFTRTITTPAAARMVRPGARPLVSLLTDFGSRDPSAGIMRAVVLGICPDAAVVDISHDVEKYRVRDAALLLWSAAPYLPVGAHVGVVDPGVGTERRAVAMETARGDFLVGPDNGLLLPAAARLGGIVRVHQLESPQYRLPVISSSFHGRDIFAPAAAHLAMGVPLEFLGPALDPRTLRLIDWPEPEVYPGVLRSSVIYLDTFGNVKLSALLGHLFTSMGQLGMGEPVYLRITDSLGTSDLKVSWVDTFGNVPTGQPLLYEDSYGRLTIAVNQGSAADVLGIREDAEVVISRAPLTGDQPWFDAGVIDQAQVGPGYGLMTYPSAGYDLNGGYPPPGYDPNAGYPPPGYDPNAGYPPPGYDPNAGYPPPGYDPNAGYPPPGYDPNAGYPPPGYDPNVAYAPPGYDPNAGHPPAGFDPNAGYERWQRPPNQPSNGNGASSGSEPGRVIEPVRPPGTDR